MLVDTTCTRTTRRGRDDFIIRSLDCFSIHGQTYLDHHERSSEAWPGIVLAVPLHKQKCCFYRDSNERVIDLQWSERFVKTYGLVLFSSCCFHPRAFFPGPLSHAVFRRYKTLQKCQFFPTHPVSHKTLGTIHENNDNTRKTRPQITTRARGRTAEDKWGKL